MNENDEHTAKGYINEAKKHVNESIDKAYESCKAMDESARPSPKDILNAISTAKKGAIASGGGYGNWTKLKDNSWKNTKTNKLSHDKGLFDRIDNAFCSATISFAVLSIPKIISSLFAFNSI